MKPNTTVLLHLSLIPQIGPVSILKIIDKIDNNSNLESLYLYNIEDFIHQFGLSPRISQILFNGLKNRLFLDEELRLINRYNVRLIGFLEKDYPESLRHIFYPPPIIYCSGKTITGKGNPFIHSKKIAIVGSRKADHYAKRFIDEIVPLLVKMGWETVSGGAYGVDSMTHKKTLEANGKTIAVFGSGLMSPYPTENKELFRAIARSGGMLLSSFPMKATPNKGNFPARNRIIAGLSMGCIVVQASEKSGALITSKFALDQGKPIFAIPGSINNELSCGCHKLIQQGAKLVTNINDILEEFGEYQNKPIIKQNKDPIISLLESPASIDEIHNQTKIPLTELQNKLFTLQLEGKVKQNFAGLWEEI